MKPELFTIGHSNHSLEQFLELLKRHRIEVLVDVRSSPYSAHWPQFNRELLKTALLGVGMRYLFLGEELGARRSERECYVEGVARYDLVAQTAAFQSGLQRVIAGSLQYRVALMCAEKDPLECHRTILVCRHLRAAAHIQHILADGSLEPHPQAEARLMKEEHVPEEDLFIPREQLLERAYDQRGQKTAFQETLNPEQPA